MDTRVKLSILKAVFRARHSADADQFDKLAEKLNKLREVRNVVAHGYWTAGDRPGTIQPTSWISSNKRGMKTHAFTARELHSAADRIRDTTWEFADFLQVRGYWKTTPSP